MKTLIIRHLKGSDPPKFEVERQGGKHSEAVTVAPPVGFPVEGRPDSDLMRELPWYLEDFLEYPYHPRTDRAQHILDALDEWGQQAFGKLFSGGKGAIWYHDATRDGVGKLRLQVMSDDPGVLQWPWEALKDPEATYLSLDFQIERRMNKVRDPVPLPEELPKDRINILLVTARPFERDAHYRSVSRPLVELIEREKIPAQVHVLRPPTFANLREHLKERPGFYHIIHFDGHGGFGKRSVTGDSRHTFSVTEGVLVFEDDKGKRDRINAERLSGLLRDHAVPVMVMNACRSAMIEEGVKDPFASVAAALLKAGIRGVVAMAYSLYVSGAEVFLPVFYKELFESGDLSGAVRAGRQKMFEKRKRICARGRFELKDFVVPVIYQQKRYELPFVKKSKKGKEGVKRELPEEARDEENPYGFIGRDQEILKLERVMRKDTPAILITGLGGVGKTTLVRGFLKWLNDTEGMDGGQWLSFIDVRSAEYVINTMGSAIFGKDFLAGKMEDKVPALANVLKQNRIVIVWDNFEVVAGILDSRVSANLSAEDRNVLLSLLKKIRGGQSKVIITSRSEEGWLGIQRMKLSIGGLVGEERWEFCEKILDNLGILVNREDEDQVELMDLLEGHPLAMSVILPSLEKMSARQIIDALRSNMDALGPEAEKLYATLRFAEEQLSEDLRPLLIPLALHEQYIQADMLENMCKQVEESWSREKVDGFLQALSVAGLLRNMTGAIYQLHPALTGFLRSTFLSSVSSEIYDKWSRVFVDVMGIVADQLAPKELHEQRFGFHIHGANFHFALSVAERLKMYRHYSALLQSLAFYAQNTRNYSEAIELFEIRANIEMEKGNKENEAAAYHQLGRVAEEQRDFAAAEKWYLKSLAIKEKQGNEHGAAITYHQLGMIAQEQRDFAAAEKWYLKSLEIVERIGDEAGAAKTYHQLGRIAQGQTDFRSAKEHFEKALEIFKQTEDKVGIANIYHLLGSIALTERYYRKSKGWYRKSLDISEVYGIENLAVMTYHQLGRVAEEQRDFAAAEKWYLKSLAITEKQGNEHGAAKTYHQLGIIAEKQRDFAAAEKWYLKSLAIKEKQGDEHGAAGTYNQLGSISGLQEDFKESGRWFIKAIVAHINSNDNRMAKASSDNFMINYRNAPGEVQAKLKAMWEEADLGPFPEVGDSPK